MLRHLYITLIFGLASFVISCGQNKTKQPSATPQPKVDENLKPKVVYGEDDRLDLYQIQDQAVLGLADATVALIRSVDLSEQADDITNIKTKHFGKSYALCESEPFYAQETAAFCSGFLVAPDIIVTAGHCISNQNDCEGIKFAFGFALHKENEIPKSVNSSQVYGCKKLITSTVTTEPDNKDFAVIQLDRPVIGHRPLNYRSSGSPQLNDDLLVIGHPSGLPTKVAGGAKIRSLDTNYFTANLDTYGGNSGSAVFNATTGVVEGILVRGENDYVYRNGCFVSNECPDGGCRGEDVSRITSLTQYLPKQQASVDEDHEDLGLYQAESKIQMQIPDDYEKGISSTIESEQKVSGREIRVTVNITHTWRGDLEVKLITPSGKSVTLHNQAGASLDDLNEVYRVEGLETEGQGEWKLQVIDHAKWDEGSLQNWKIEFK